MSINMDGPGDVEYADHEVQVINQSIVFEGEGSGEATGADFIHDTEPVSNRGIDSNELAELVYMYRALYLQVQNSDASNQTEVAELDCESTLGINLSPDELPTRASNIGSDVTDDAATTVVSGQDDGTLNVSNFEEPGVLDVSRSTADLGFNEIGDGTGGPGSMNDSQERDMNFRSAFGSGPFVDRTDDLSLALEAGAINITEDIEVRAEVTYILYWNVMEAAGGRGAFARP